MAEQILTTGAGAEQRAINQLVAWSARGNPAQMALLVECSVFEVFFGGARDCLKERATKSTSAARTTGGLPGMGPLEDGISYARAWRAMAKGGR